MKTLLCKTRRATSAAIVAIFLAVLAANSIARGQITYLKSYGISGPEFVAVGATGQVYVDNSGSYGVYVLDSNFDGTPTFFGSYGSGNGQFAGPSGIAVGPSGQIYVADAFNGNIQVFSSSGNYESSFGGNGSGNGQLNAPLGITSGASGQIYVADNGNRRVEVFDSSGNYLATIGGTAGQISYPQGVAVSSSGLVYVTDSGYSRVDVFNSSGTYQSSFGSNGNGPGQFQFPYGVAVSATGLVYVADTNNNRIQVFGSYGTYTQFSSAGTAGQMNQPFDVAVSPTGEIYVTDFSNNQIEKYFSLSEWVSGSPHLDTADIGPGQLLGASLTLDTTRGLLVDGALTIHPGGSLTQSGTVTAGSFTNSGQYTLNGGLVTVTSGTLTNNTTMTLNGGIVSGSLTNYYGASLNAQGTVTGNLVNQGTLTQNGLFSVGGNVTNSALVVLSTGGAITGGGTLANGPAGTIRGDGAITMTVDNNGLIYANGTNGLTLASFIANEAGGELRIADGDSLTVYAAANGTFNNLSTIDLKGPDASLSGDTFDNTGVGTISGQGRITNSIYNQGTLTAVGGQLLLAGYAVSNYPGGTIRSAAGTSILVSQGLGQPNYGLIALAGGSFDNGPYSMANYGSILGNGTFSSGGLFNIGTVTFANGNSSIYGSVNNASGGTLTMQGTSANVITFYGAVTNSGYIKINGTTVSWVGGLANNGTYISDPAANYFTGLAVGAGGLLQGGVGDQFFVTGTLSNSGDIDLGGTSELVVENGGTLTQTSGVLHLGTSATLTAGAVEINGGTLLADGPLATITASLTYASSSTSNYQGILAGSGNKLILDNPAAQLILSGENNSYTGGTYVEAGTLEITSAGAIPNGSSLSIGAGAALIFDSALSASPVEASAGAVNAVPEPGTLGLLAGGALGLLGYGWRRRGTKA